MSGKKIDNRVYDLYDDYCHGYIDRRQFFERAAALTVSGVSALAMAEALLPNYAEAQEVSFTDERIKANYVEYPSPGGTSGTMRGYLVRPADDGPFPGIVVIHENRGLNPYIEDVAPPAMTMTAAKCSERSSRRNSCRIWSTARYSSGTMSSAPARSVLPDSAGAAVQPTTWHGKLGRQKLGLVGDCPSFRVVKMGLSPSGLWDKTPVAASRQR